MMILRAAVLVAVVLLCALVTPTLGYYAHKHTGTYGTSTYSHTAPAYDTNTDMMYIATNNELIEMNMTTFETNRIPLDVKVFSVCLGGDSNTLYMGINESIHQLDLTTHKLAHFMNLGTTGFLIASHKTTLYIYKERTIVSVPMSGGPITELLTDVSVASFDVDSEGNLVFTEKIQNGRYVLRWAPASDPKNNITLDEQEKSFCLYEYAFDRSYTPNRLYARCDSLTSDMMKFTIKDGKLESKEDEQIGNLLIQSSLFSWPPFVPFAAKWQLLAAKDGDLIFGEFYGVMILEPISGLSWFIRWVMVVSSPVVAMLLLISPVVIFCTVIIIFAVYKLRSSAHSYTLFVENYVTPTPDKFFVFLSIARNVYFLIVSVFNGLISLGLVLIGIFVASSALFGCSGTFCAKLPIIGAFFVGCSIPPGICLVLFGWSPVLHIFLAIGKNKSRVISLVAYGVSSIINLIACIITAMVTISAFEFGLIVTELFLLALIPLGMLGTAIVGTTLDFTMVFYIHSLKKLQKVTLPE